MRVRDTNEIATAIRDSSFNPNDVKNIRDSQEEEFESLTKPTPRSFKPGSIVYVPHAHNNGYVQAVIWEMLPDEMINVVILDTQPALQLGLMKFMFFEVF